MDTKNEILTIICNGEKLYVDRVKILLILFIKYNIRAFKLSDRKIIDLIKEKGLVDKELFVRINKA